MSAPLRDLVVITGFSGAGKSQAMACFEDAGYFCVDNLPPEMIENLADLLEHEGSNVERAAVVCDVRGGRFFEALVRVLGRLAERGTPHRVLYLEASEEVLVNRFKETRRRHPLAATDPHVETFVRSHVGTPLASADGELRAGQLERAIRLERRLLEPLKEQADVVIDTSDLTAARLRQLVAEKMLPRGRSARLAVSLLSFGFKHGTPRDIDLLFDVRFLPNPHYEPELRPLTGLDEPVRRYVEQSAESSELERRILDLLDFLLPRYEREGRAHLTIGIGCTGGRHRSVVLAERIAAALAAHDRYLVDVVHRDIDRAAPAPRAAVG
ncbi:RNase adapter RapZ [Thermoleophilum album]|uniref:RNase adapter RapZ n=1 Tax=Thermoleophilum album TaxID=29539 RepID=UPI00237CFE33|nr:RNase adapter RapZ [Thermoleophilum album]WDT94219.1 RNase adapter RapZ [Thermoleophilum album]